MSDRDNQSDRNDGNRGQARSLDSRGRHERHEHREHREGCLCCAGGPRAMAAAVDRMVQTVGFALVTIMDASPPFAYSAGLHGSFGLPEFIVVGYFGPVTLNAVAACVHNLVASNPGALRGRGPSIPDALPCTDPDNPAGPPVSFALGWKPVPLEKIIFGSGTPMPLAIQKANGAAIEVRQLFLPDTRGKLPWDPDCDAEWIRDAEQTDLSA